MDLVNLNDYESAAREQLTPMAWDYYRSGAEDMHTLRRNRDAWAEIALRYRVLVDVSQRELATTVLGMPISFPALVAPTAFHRLACEEGEVATARAAKAAGTIMTLSTLSNRAIEDVAAAADGPWWFQLYVYGDRDATVQLIRRAEAAGARAIVWTVDATVWGRREPDIRNRFHLPAGLTAENLTASGMDGIPADVATSGLAAYVDTFLDRAMSWETLDWLRGVTELPIVVKGLVRGDDAARAIDGGANAVVVSNHGGRQLDGSPATVEALPDVVDAVAGRAEVYIDGGVRRGVDIIRALVLGARAVLIGRPILWGLAVDGEAGAGHVLELLRHEYDTAQALCGARTPDELTADLRHEG